VPAEFLHEREGQRGAAALGAAGHRRAGRKAHLHELVRPIDRERAQPHEVEELEDRGVGADAERERHDGDRGHRLVPPQHAPRVPEVLPQRVEPAEGVHPVDLLAHARGVAQLAMRGRAGGVRRQAARQVRVGFDLEVGLDLAGGILVATRALEVAAPTMERETGRHRRSPPVLTRLPA